jgi:hypothetical protein
MTTIDTVDAYIAAQKAGRTAKAARAPHDHSRGSSPSN